MDQIRDQLKSLFNEFDEAVKRIKTEREREGLSPIAKAKVQLLGQVSLLANNKVSATLSLAQTGDLDALLTMSYVVKMELEKLLPKYGLVYDEDSRLIFIPPGSRFDLLFDLENVVVEMIDAESTLVSKAVKAPEKNKQLIREAISSEVFPGLVDRILKNGGKLEKFL